MLDPSLELTSSYPLSRLVSNLIFTAAGLSDKQGQEDLVVPMIIVPNNSTVRRCSKSLLPTS